MLPWKLRKRHILPASQNLLSVYFSLAKFQLVSCNLSLAMIWQRTYTHELPKLCSATLIYLNCNHDSHSWAWVTCGSSRMLGLQRRILSWRQLFDVAQIWRTGSFTTAMSPLMTFLTKTNLLKFISLTWESLQAIQNSVQESSNTHTP